MVGIPARQAKYTQKANIPLSRTLIYNWAL
jgi:hypothetical protein